MQLSLVRAASVQRYHHCSMTSLPTIPPRRAPCQFLTPAAALLHVPPPSHVRPRSVALAQPVQPLAVVQLPDEAAPPPLPEAQLLEEAAPPGQNGLVPVLHQSRNKPWTWGTDRYQAILARWRSFVWELRHRQWLVRLRLCYEVRPLMAR